MNKELELQLVEKYPKILRDYGGDIMKTAMHFGFQHENGWEEILDKCMEKIQYLCDAFSKNGKEVQVFFTTVKEKFGTLRVYYDIEGEVDNPLLFDDIVDDIIGQTERQSATTCEVTGKYGESCHRGGWCKTLCYEEARKLGYKACKQSTEDYWVSKDIKKQNGEQIDNEN